MTYILKVVRPINIQSWVAVNAPASLKDTGRESWRAYMAANSGSGASLSSLELSFLKNAGAQGGTLIDLWGNYNSAQVGATVEEKCRNKYR